MVHPKIVSPGAVDSSYEIFRQKTFCEYHNSPPGRVDRETRRVAGEKIISSRDDFSLRYRSLVDHRLRQDNVILPLHRRKRSSIAIVSHSGKIRGGLIAADAAAEERSGPGVRVLVNLQIKQR